MRSFLHPRLVNGPFDDPGLFLPFFFENRAMMFDLGSLLGLLSLSEQEMEQPELELLSELLSVLILSELVTELDLLRLYQT